MGLSRHWEQLKELKELWKREKEVLEERVRVADQGGDPLGFKDSHKEKDNQINYLQMQEQKLKEVLQLKHEEHDIQLQELHRSLENNKEIYRKKYLELDEKLKLSEQ